MKKHPQLALRKFFAAVALCVPFCMAAQEPVTVEFFIDSDPGYGKAQSFSRSEGAGAYKVSLEGVAPGAHTIGVRICDADGNWSSTVTYPLYVTTPADGQTTAEFFVDSDPGYGKAQSFSHSEGEDSYEVSLEGVAPGAHTIGVRICDAHGHWSSTVTYPLYVTAPEGLTTAEFYVDSDPGKGQGTPLQIMDDRTIQFAVPTDDIVLGEHILYVRGLTAEGEYVALLEAPFTVKEADGIVSATWDVQVSITHIDGTLSISGESLTAGSLVEIHNVAGQCLLHTETSYEGETVTFGTVGRVGPYIVTVLTASGKRMTQRVL